MIVKQESNTAVYHHCQAIRPPAAGIVLPLFLLAVQVCSMRCRQEKQSAGLSLPVNPTQTVSICCRARR